MLPAQRRVRRREEFSATVRQGRRIAAPGLVLHLRTEESNTPARAGFIVGRSIGPAVRRNRVRRQVRHLIAPYLDRLPAGTVIVVRLTDAAARLTGPELAASLEQAFVRANKPGAALASAVR